MSAILQDISEKLQKGKMKEVAELVKQAVADGIQPLTILNEGLMPGMDIIGERFKKNDIFIPEVLIAARAMAAGTDVLRPLLVGDQMEEKGTVVIGTIAFLFVAPTGTSTSLPSSSLSIPCCTDSPLTSRWLAFFFFAILSISSMNTIPVSARSTSLSAAASSLEITLSISSPI